VRSIVVCVVALSSAACGERIQRAQSDATAIEPDAEGDLDVGARPDTGTAADAASELPVPPTWPDGGSPHAAAIWVRQANATNVHYEDIALVPSTGAVVVGGQYDGKINLGDSERSSGGPAKPWLARYGADGALTWTLFPEAPSGRVLRVGVDASESIWIGGEFRFRINLGGATLEASEAIFRSAFLAKLAGDARHLWSRALIGPTAMSGYAAVGPVARIGDDVLVAGAFSGTIDLGAGPIDSSTGTGILARLRADGSQVFARVFAGNAGFRRAAACSTGRIVALGQYQGEATFGSTTLPKLDPGSGISPQTAEWVGLFESGGAPIWVRALALRPKAGATRYRAGHVTAVACARGDTAIAVGDFEGEADFGDGRTVSTPLTSNGFAAWIDDKGVLTRLETSPDIVRHGVGDIVADDTGITLLVYAGAYGTYGSLVRVGGAGVEWARTIAPEHGLFRLLRDSLGNHFVAGGFSRSIELCDSIKLSARGDGFDGFVAKLGP